MVVLKATVRDPGEGPRTKLITGAQAPRTKRRQRTTPESSPISSARGWPKARTTNQVSGWNRGARVPSEQVERAALRVDEDVAQVLVGDANRGRLSVRGLRQGRGAARVAAAAGDRQRSKYQHCRAGNECD